MGIVGISMHSLISISSNIATFCGWVINENAFFCMNWQRNDIADGCNKIFYPLILLMFNDADVVGCISTHIAHVAIAL